jgi:hypothetical protein
MTIAFLIILITQITCFNKKYFDVKTISNPEKFTNYYDIFNLTDSEMIPVNKFHEKIHLKKFIGEWKSNTTNTNFKKMSGSMRMGIKIYKISKNGREINFKLIVADGLYRNNWMIIDQSFLYFIDNNEDSDITYNITDEYVELVDKGYNYRGNEIRFNKLYNYYLKYGKWC